MPVGTYVEFSAKWQNHPFSGGFLGFQTEEKPSQKRVIVWFNQDRKWTQETFLARKMYRVTQMSAHSFLKPIFVPYMAEIAQKYKIK